MRVTKIRELNLSSVRQNNKFSNCKTMHGTFSLTSGGKMSMFSIGIRHSERGCGNSSPADIHDSGRQSHDADLMYC